jgi:hypothetical protein
MAKKVIIGIQSTYAVNRLPLKLTIIMLVLAACHIAVMIVHYTMTELPWLLRELFDLDEEQSFGTWFTVVILLFAARLLLLQARRLRGAKLPHHMSWMILGLGFCFLSLDEVVGLHETLNTLTDFSWTLPGAMVSMLVGFIYIPFLNYLPSRTRLLFMLSGAIYVGAAVGIESATDWYADEDLLDTLEYNLTTVLEEALEMTGVILFIYAILSHMAGGKNKDVTEQIHIEP